jgi:hypothetical protein
MSRKAMPQDPMDLAAFVFSEPLPAKAAVFNTYREKSVLNAQSFVPTEC